ncbi:MAG: hypothetical protein K2U26_13040, partial [Cyclobacteriaceae bacterium]|nr:hypothetical protein [Cyclobacteriaceae bacterium]
VELLPPGWEVLISSDKRKIRVYAVDFAGLEKITLQDFSVVTTALESEEKMKKLGRNSIGSVMTLEQNKVTQKSMKYTFPGDQIFLTAKGGVGLFRDKLYPELTAVLGLTFRDRYRRPNIRPSISYNYMFFAERSTEGFAMNTNSFLSGSFEFNSNKKESTPSWSGIGVGWLMRRNGDYFTGNTAKFFITQTLPNSRLQLVPEFYLTDDLKKFAFGVGMKFSF